MNIHAGPRTESIRLGYAAEVDPETLVKRAEEALDRPRDAAFWDDDLYSTHTLAVYWAPDSDDLVAQSNYECILDDLSEAYRRHPGAIEEASIGHWTYSRFNCIKVRVLYANGEIHPAFADLVQILDSLDSYPLYSEDHYSDLESKEWDRAISEAVRYALGDESDADEIRDDVMEWLYSEEAEIVGWHECGYVPDEKVETAIDRAREIHAAAHALGLLRPNESGEPLPGL